jgi:hypothetical protein
MRINKLKLQIMKKAAVILLMLVTACVVVFAQKPAVVTSNEPGWQKIGEITASFKMQNESIVVLGADEFDAIKLKVTDAPIHIERVQVFYESGDLEEINVRNELQAGGETRVIKLDHPERDIQKVAFTYKTLPNYRGEKAQVELHGLKTPPKDTEAYRNDNDNDNDNDVEEAAEKVERDAEKAGDEIEEETEEAADNVEKETATVKDGFNESVSIVEAEIKDQVYADKFGPNNEVIYIDSNSKYYYIDKKGNKIFILKSQMKDKPKKKDNK